MPGFTAVACSDARVAWSPCSLVSSEATLAWFWSWSRVAVDWAVASCCSAWVSWVWSWLTFWASWLHAGVDAPFPAQSWVLLAWSALRVDRGGVDVGLGGRDRLVVGGRRVGFGLLVGGQGLLVLGHGLLGLGDLLGARPRRGGDGVGAARSRSSRRPAPYW